MYVYYVWNIKIFYHFSSFFFLSRSFPSSSILAFWAASQYVFKFSNYTRNFFTTNSTDFFDRAEIHKKVLLHALPSSNHAWTRIMFKIQCPLVHKILCVVCGGGHIFYICIYTYIPNSHLLNRIVHPCFISFPKFYLLLYSEPSLNIIIPRFLEVRIVIPEIRHRYSRHLLPRPSTAPVYYTKANKYICRLILKYEILCFFFYYLKVQHVRNKDMVEFSRLWEREEGSSNAN